MPRSHNVSDDDPARELDEDAEGHMARGRVSDDDVEGHGARRLDMDDGDGDEVEGHIHGRSVDADDDDEVEGHIQLRGRG